MSGLLTRVVKPLLAASSPKGVAVPLAVGDEETVVFPGLTFGAEPFVAPPDFALAPAAMQKIIQEVVR